MKPLAGRLLTRHGMTEGSRMGRKKVAGAPKPSGMQQMGPAIYAQIRQAVRELATAPRPSRAP